MCKLQHATSYFRDLVIKFRRLLKKSLKSAEKMCGTTLKNCLQYPQTLLCSVFTSFSVHWLIYHQSAPTCRKNEGKMIPTAYYLFGYYTTGMGNQVTGWLHLSGSLVPLYNLGDQVTPNIRILQINSYVLYSQTFKTSVCSIVRFNS